MLERQLIIYVLVGISSVVSDAAQNYGAFDLLIRRFDPCKGPKTKDCATVSAKIQNSAIVYYDMNVTQAMAPTKGKIVVISSNGKQLMRLQMDNPCQHLFMRPLFESLFNVTQNCVVRKGHYVFDVDLQKIADKYYAGAFLYGNMTFKSSFYNNQCNLSCTAVKVTLSPKENKNQQKNTNYGVKN